MNEYIKIKFIISLEKKLKYKFSLKRNEIQIYTVPIK